MVACRWIALALVVVCACAKPQPPDVATLREVAATVKRFPIDADSWILISDADPDMRYVPDALPQALCEDGLHVVFDAALAPVPENVRMVGTPIRLLRIRARDATPRS